MAKQKVSVIIPVYNGEKYIATCIESMLNQTYANIEIIIIDDGSTDQTARICDQYKNEKIIVIHKENAGASAARNTGLDIASGSYIVFVDADDNVELTYIEDMYKCMIKNNFDMMVCAYFKELENGNEKIFSAPHSCKWNSKQAQMIMFENNYFGGYPWNKMFKMDIVRENNIRFDVDLAKSEDMLWVLKYLRYSFTVGYLAKPLYHYRYNEGSICREIKNNRRFNEKELTNIEAHTRMYDLICKDDKRLINAFYCRLVCTYMRLIVNMCYGEYFDKNILRECTKNIRKNIVIFLKSSSFGIAQKGGASLMCIHPKVFWMVYVILNKVTGITIE